MSYDTYSDPARFETIEPVDDCADCDGTGICPDCEDDGKSCIICNETGECLECGGEGIVSDG